MRGIYRDGWRGLRDAWWIILGLALLPETLPILLDRDNGATTGTLPGFIFYALLFPRHLLLGEPLSLRKRAPSPAPLHMAKFMGVSLGSLALVVCGGLLILWAFGFSLRDQGAEAVFLFSLAVANLLTLTALGPAFPAAAVSDPVGPAITRGWRRGSYRRIFGGLLVGPGLIGLIGLSAVAAASRALALPEDVMTPATSALNPAARIMGVVNTTLAVVVLCRVYRADQP